MKTTDNQTNFSIKKKIIAALSMLLVAVVMLVSSTYAWFTLSTKPEVEGVSTAVGANGALEMLLATKDANGVWIYESGEVGGLTPTQRNIYWGNLVDLTDPIYGSQAITLYPSQINLTADGKFNPTAPLKIPEYDKDGRVLRVTENGQFGTFSGGAFQVDGESYGFRGLGVASGLTTRQKAFNTAISATATAAYNAQTEARNSLSANGTALARIAILKAMNAADAMVYTQADIDAIGSMITGLELSLKQVEDAYVQAIVAYALSSSSNQATDTAAESLAAAITSAATGAGSDLGAKLEAVFSLLGSNPSINVTAIQGTLAGYNKYTQAVDDINDAKTANNIPTNTEYCWNDIKDALSALVDVTNIKINDIPAGEVTQPDNKNQIAADILGSKGIKVNMPTGGGIYADIADFAGDYTVDITINSSDLKVGVDGLPISAYMTADSTNDINYLSTIRSTISASAPSKSGATAQALSEIYGYVIDLAFRTNAPQSNLLLQTDEANRIYAGSTDDSTMGAGSTMTFKSISPDFTAQKVKDLMKNIRVVFYSTDEGNMAEVYATAKLDLVNDVVEDANGITAKLYIDENKIDTAGSENAIVALNQNEIKHISALVYLDGETIQNDDVAATVAESITGTVNLQFASSAELDPMDYGEYNTMG